MGFWATLSFLTGKQDRPHIHCSHTAFAEGRIRERIRVVVLGKDRIKIGGRSDCLLLEEGLEKKLKVVIFCKGMI